MAHTEVKPDLNEFVAYLQRPTSQQNILEFSDIVSRLFPIRSNSRRRCVRAAALCSANFLSNHVSPEALGWLPEYLFDMPPRAVRNHPRSEGHGDRDVFGRDDSNASSRAHSGAHGATNNPVRASDGHRQHDEAGPSDRTEIHAHSNIPSTDYPPEPHLGSTVPHDEYTSVSLPPLRLDDNTAAHSDPRPPHPRLPPIETQVAIHPPSAYSSNAPRPVALAPSSPVNTTSSRASGAQQARTGTNSSSSYSASVLSHNRATTFTSSAPSSAPSSAFQWTPHPADVEYGQPCKN
ncbi:hypothetical protein FRC08_012173 [Ceratobasidium sp. 394]|nr:hypothetical protein FRC08_012173 [Ceratobasidium sp. 394]